MQELNMLHTEQTGFWLIFSGLVLAIVVQSLIYQEDMLKYTAGEYVVLLVGGIYVLISSIRKGLWSRRIPATLTTNLILSAAISAIFSVMLGIIKFSQYGSVATAVISAIIFFFSMTVLAFVVMAVLMRIYKKRSRKLEQDGEE